MCVFISVHVLARLNIMINHTIMNNNYCITRLTQ